MTNAQHQSGGLVLVHGLGRTWRSMVPLSNAGVRRGYSVLNVRYHSRAAPLATLAESFAEAIEHFLPGEPLHFTTHSLGGILLRAAVARGLVPLRRVARVVMLAPPNRGSQLAAGLTANPVFRWYYGPAGAELADGAHWPAPPGRFAVIAGTRGRSLINPTSFTVARRFPAGVVHDGTVAVDETRLDGMAAFAEVDATHTWIMNDARARTLAMQFLRAGCFENVTVPP
jgi:hypothetical protein